MIGVLFVCTGNICRSPTAEAVLRALAERAGLADKVSVDSAATHDYHVGEAPDPRSIAHARRRGYDLSSLRARRMGAEDFTHFDLILACDRGHHTILQRSAPPQSRARLSLFLDYAPDLHLTDLPDPYHGRAVDFERVLDIVEHAAGKLLAALRTEIG